MEANMNANEISQGLNRLNNRLDEALNRSQSATLNSHRSLSGALEAAPQEVYRTAAPCTTEEDLYRSVQNYQVKTVNGFEPNYFPVQNNYPVQNHYPVQDHYPVQNHYQSFVPAQNYIQPYAQPLVIPFGHQYPVQEVRSATYGYEPIMLSSPTHFYQPLEYVDDYEGRLSQRNQSSGKKKSTRARKQDLQNDDDSFSKDTKKSQPQAQQNQTSNSAPQKQAAPQTQAAQTQPPQTQAAQTQPPQQNQASPQKQAAPQTQAAQTQPPQTQAAQTQPPQQKQAAPQTQAAQTQPPQTQAAQTQPPQQNGQPQQKPALDKSNLVMLPKKPYLIDTHNFGQEKRRGGSQRI